MPRKNDIRVAVTRSMSRSRPIEIVAPTSTPRDEREALRDADDQTIHEGDARPCRCWVRRLGAP
jgi:hypothetical protein